jgi:CRP-like cAMP-binding protein
MDDPITAADRKRADALAELAQAAEQCEAWELERVALLHKVIALGVSQRQAAPYARLTQGAVSKILARRHRRPNVAKGGSKT